VTSKDIRSSATWTALMDRHMSGWTDSDTGQLVTGVIVKPGQRVVDVGCGNGDYINFCATLGADVVFIDTKEDKIRALEERIKKSAKGSMKGIVSTCDPIPLDNEYADLVICTEVLEHVRDPEAFLREMVRIGRRDATYVITVPDARSELLIKNLAPPAYFSEPNHIHIFSAQEFEVLAKKCGLEVIRHDFISAFWSLFNLFKWATCVPGESLVENAHPTTYYWTLAWDAMLKHPNGRKVQEALNRSLPRCQVLVARRKGEHVS
jgi:ubiquinone/menaquinone biosynthesis C-methylase UbiE